MPRIETDVKLDFSDVLIRPKRSTLVSRSEVDITRTFRFRNATRRDWTGVPIMAANMDTVGTFEMATVFARHKSIVITHKYYELEDWRNFIREYGSEILQFIGISCGMSDTDIAKTVEIVREFPQIGFVCLDVANGYQEAFVAAVKRVRELLPEQPIIAGNVVTAEMTEELLLAGADIIKIGIGPGSHCTTRKITGVGYPQLSAIIECADAAHGLGGHIIGDGGCTCPGDVAKAFGGGADFVMMGGYFAGHVESGGEIIEKADGKMYKRSYGMSSAAAMRKYAASGSVATYRASEGKVVDILFRGPVEPTLLELCGGVRSACTYVGAAALRELSKRTTFVRVGK
jgi:GMP reductase